ncbi:hypothetical protein PGN35_011195 [Nodosilinea sp. PGN35]|uniref:hypothetical protein n=1 Tax=Nodosilinea sp. PGN35 TaxID=3020489 RepID=UPI0023B20CD3|nr:hypothetical protein [Nodosilinea sp. TSF1-S3]MDF0366404.1 hypothetical protein [Nodosilinea sp. TSF1-S3]
MVRILSTGTALNIAVTTGDAGQLGMAAEFDGYFSGPIYHLTGRLISRVSHLFGGLVRGNFDGSDRSKWDAPRGDRPRADLILGLWPSLTPRACLSLGERLWPYPHYFSRHSVYQH